MAFNFNWSPLMADADFYKRAQEVLTTALNKSPKPPIIVDDIIVSELNLGTVPPDLEILEIGDLAEDRFRGIFKMCYSGDAFLTLKTKVQLLMCKMQANPMNTYLSSTSSFTSPQPLAAASGLMIPLQISLSEIRLSAFIILVFSRQKGLTLVFRNDPLESLKVSSTFDSIPFVRDYLQKEIDIQLRTLMMDELPAIIHRLSLRLWCADCAAKEFSGTEERKNCEEQVAVNPFASPPQDAVDSRGNVLDASEISSLSLDGGSEIHLLFSQKNFLRLSALRDSHRTLSLFTPSIRDAVFRAWASPSDRGDTAGTTTPLSPSLKLVQTTVSGGNTLCSLNRNLDDGVNPSGLSSHQSSTGLISTTGLSLGSTRISRSHLRKKKARIINLRKPKSLPEDYRSNFDQEKSGAVLESTSTTITPEPEDQIITPPSSPSQRIRFHRNANENLKVSSQTHCSTESSSSTSRKNLDEEPGKNMSPSMDQDLVKIRNSNQKLPISIKKVTPCQDEKKSKFSPTVEENYTSSTILSQAWILKMAKELARCTQTKNTQKYSWLQSENEDGPPPAYEARFT